MRKLVLSRRVGGGAGFVTALLFAFAADIRGAEASLQAYIAEALAHNPALRASGLEREAAKQRVRQVASLPDPELSVGVSVPPMERFMGDQIATVSLMQMFPAFGTRAAARDEAAAMAAMRGEAARDARIETVYGVKVAWAELYAAYRDVRAAEEDLELLRALERIALERYGTGDEVSAPRRSMGGTSGASGVSSSGSAGGGGMAGMSAMGASGQGGGSAVTPSGLSGAAGTSTSASSMAPMGGASTSGMAELMRLRLDILEAEDLLERRRADVRVTTLRLNRLRGREATTPVTPPDTVLAAKSSAPDTLLLSLPVLRMLEEEERALAAMERMNKRMGLPMFGVGVQYEYLRERTGGMGAAPGGGMWMPMASVSLPLWRGKVAGGVREASLRREAVADRRTDVRAELQTQLAEARRDMEDAARRVERAVAREELARVSRDLVAVRAGAGASESAVTELLEAERELTEARRRVARAIADNNIAVARLERLTGDAP